jgi:hypothetical protein
LFPTGSSNSKEFSEKFSTLVMEMDMVCFYYTKTFYLNRLRILCSKISDSPPKTDSSHTPPHRKFSQVGRDLVCERGKDHRKTLGSRKSTSSSSSTTSPIFLDPKLLFYPNRKRNVILLTFLPTFFNLPSYGLNNDRVRRCRCYIDNGKVTNVPGKTSARL